MQRAHLGSPIPPDEELQGGRCELDVVDRASGSPHLARRSRVRSLRGLSRRLPSALEPHHLLDDRFALLGDVLLFLKALGAVLAGALLLAVHGDRYQLVDLFLAHFADGHAQTVETRSVRRQVADFPPSAPRASPGDCAGPV